MGSTRRKPRVVIVVWSYDHVEVGLFGEVSPGERLNIVRHLKISVDAGFIKDSGNESDLYYLNALVNL